MSEPDFEEIFSDAREGALETLFGRSGTYTLPNKTDPIATGLTWLIDEGALPITTSTETATKDSRSGQLTIRQDLLAQPVKGGRFADDRDEWTVTAQPQLVDGIWNCPVSWSRKGSQGTGRRASSV